MFEGTLCGERLFCPGEDLPRWVMAVWLVRAIDGDDPAPSSGSAFVDLPGDPWWEDHVVRLAELGITRGCSTDGPRFCPDATVTRQQMAAFFKRAYNFPASAPAGFTDIAGSPFESEINSIAAFGITSGCSLEPLQFCPEQAVSRAQMATFIARAIDPVRFARVSDYLWTSGAGGLHEQSVFARSLSSYRVTVHLCAAEGSITSRQFADAVSSLSDTVNTFFNRVSNDRVSIALDTGKLYEVPNPNWARGADRWGRPVFNFEAGQCMDEVLIPSEFTHQLVLIQEVPGDSWDQYSVPGWAFNTTAVVLASHDLVFSPTDLLVLVHELGHSVLGLCHPDGEHCRTHWLQRHIRGERVGGSEFQQFHEDHVYLPQDDSFMTSRIGFPFPLDNLEMNCAQRWLKGFDDEWECDGESPELEVDVRAELPIIDYTREHIEGFAKDPHADDPVPDFYVAELDGALEAYWSVRAICDTMGYQVNFDLQGAVTSDSYRDTHVCVYDSPEYADCYIREDYRYRQDGLVNDQTVTVTVRPVTARGFGRSRTLFSTPQERPPEGYVPGPAINVSAISFNTVRHDISIRWEPPMYHGDTPITDYRVRNRAVGAGDWTSAVRPAQEARHGVYGRYNDTLIWLSKGTANLLSNTDYEIGVAAVNSAGAGPETITTVRTN